MKKLWLAVLFLLLLGSTAFGADLSIPWMELITRGYLENDSFLLSTRGNMEFAVSGGYKFGGQIKFGFESDDLEDLSLDRSLQFTGASITLRSLFDLPLSLTYFTGESDTFATGDIFPDFFGSKIISSRFSGYLYFPDPDQVRYDGIRTVSGTGFHVSTNFNSEHNQTSLYAYQDQYLGTGTYSVDLATAFNWELVKLESFLGASFPVGNYGYYRTGLLLFFDTGQGGEFLTQIGIPKWDPELDTFDLSLFYFLFEPRVSFGFFSIILTLLWHPAYYYYLPTNAEETGWITDHPNYETNETGSADINANFQFGDPNISTASGGIEAKLGFSSTGASTGGDQFKAVVSPYFRAITAGVVWDVKVNARVFPWDLGDMFEIFIGVQAEF